MSQYVTYVSGMRVEADEYRPADRCMICLRWHCEQHLGDGFFLVELNRLLEDLFFFPFFSSLSFLQHKFQPAGSYQVGLR